MIFSSAPQFGVAERITGAIRLDALHHSIPSKTELPPPTGTPEAEWTVSLPAVTSAGPAGVRGPRRRPAGRASRQPLRCAPSLRHHLPGDAPAIRSPNHPLSLPGSSSTSIILPPPPRRSLSRDLTPLHCLPSPSPSAHHPPPPPSILSKPIMSPPLIRPGS